MELSTSINFVFAIELVGEFNPFTTAAISVIRGKKKWKSASPIFMQDLRAMGIALFSCQVCI